MSAFVYVVHANNGEIKVGLSVTPHERLSKIKKEYSHRRGFSEAYLVGFVSTRYGLSVERLAHGFLGQYAVGGEWYRVHPLIALRVVIKAAYLFQEDVLVYTEGPKVDVKASIKTLRSLIGARSITYRR